MDSLEEMPFYSLFNYQLCDLYESCQMKYSDILENYSLKNFVAQNAPKQLSETSECNYYDIDTMNTMCASVTSSTSVFHINLQSSFKSYGLLKAYLSTMNMKFDIYAISEAKNTKIDLCKNLLENYIFEYRIPSSNPKGGVAIYYTKEISENIKERNDLVLNQNNASGLEDMWLEFEKQNKKFVIAIIYRHPRDSLEPYYEKLQANFETISKEGKSLILCGDLNIDLLKQNNPHVRGYTELLFGSNVIPVITLPTRLTSHSATLIDHINVQRPLGALKDSITSGNIFLDISDHLPSFIIINHADKMKEDRPRVRIYSTKNINLFNTELQKINWQELENFQNPNDCYNKFISVFLKLFNKYFPLVRLSRSRVKDKKWITKGLKISIKHKARLFKKCITKPNFTNKFVYKRYKNMLTTLLRSSEKAYYTALLSESKSSTKQIWKVYGELMNNKGKKRNNITKILNEGSEITDPRMMADIFNKYFSTVGQNLARKFSGNNDNFHNYLNNRGVKSMFLSPISEVEILQEINKLKTDKSPGIDEIPPKLVKASANFLLYPLSCVFNLSFKQGIVPDPLKIAKVVPIYKKGQKSLTSNYRPISLLSIFNKILEKLMCKRLCSFLIKENILYKYQFGFRQNHSTTLALIEIIDNIQTELDKGNSVIGTYLDLSKAFDTVNHSILIEKLEHYGIRGNVKNWFKNYLSNRKQVTFVNKCMSHVETKYWSASEVCTRPNIVLVVCQ